MLDERQTDRTDENSWDTVWSRTSDRRKRNGGDGRKGSGERKRKKRKGTKVYKGEEISRKIKKRGREKEEFDDQDRTEADTVRCMKVRGVRGRRGEATVISILNAIPRTTAKLERERERKRERRTLQNFERPLCPDLIRMCILSDNHEDHLALSMMISLFFLFSRDLTLTFYREIIIISLQIRIISSEIYNIIWI